MNIKNNFNFLNKFSHYLLIGLSSLVLFAGVQAGMVGDFTQRGPNTVLAEEDNCWDPFNYGCPEFGGVGEEYPTPVEPTSAPVVPAPVCSGPEFKYNQCTGCNESEPVYQNSCGEYSTGPRQYDGVCSSWCEAPAPQPTSPPSQQCTPNDQVSVWEGCREGTTQWCKRNEWLGSSCNTGLGGFYGCQDDARCGLVQPTPTPQPTLLPPQPTQPPPPPSCRIDTIQACQPNTTLLCNYSVNSCTGARSGPTNCFNATECGFRVPTPPPSCTFNQRVECQSGTTLLCTYNVNSCSGARSAPFNCFNAAQCGYRPPVIPTPPPPTGGQPPIIINNPPANVILTQPHTQTQTTGPVTQTQTQTVTVPAQTTTVREVIREARTFGNVGVATTKVAGVSNVKELPKTGLPALAWAALAFIPAGFKIRKFSKVAEDAASKAHFIWEDRQFKV